MSEARYPVFDKDGKYLYFAASTDAGPSMDIDVGSFFRPVSRSIYLVVLAKNQATPLAPESDEEKIATETKSVEKLDVALKSLARADVGGVYDLKREFRTLADLSHPNLVSLYELFAEDGQWFIAMELVNGVEFLEYVRGGMPAEAGSPAGLAHLTVPVLTPKRW